PPRYQPAAGMATTTASSASQRTMLKDVIEPSSRPQTKNATTIAVITSEQLSEMRKSQLRQPALGEFRTGSDMRDRRDTMDTLSRLRPRRTPSEATRLFEPPDRGGCGVPPRRSSRTNRQWPCG